MGNFPLFNSFRINEVAGDFWVHPKGKKIRWKNIFCYLKYINYRTYNHTALSYVRTCICLLQMNGYTMHHCMHMLVAKCEQYYV